MSTSQQSDTVEVPREQWDALVAALKLPPVKMIGSVMHAAEQAVLAVEGEI